MPIDGNTPINLTVSLDSANVILASLSAQPYEKVAGIIGSIQQQAAPQVQAAQAPAPEEAAPAAWLHHMNDMQEPLIPNRITVADMQAKVKSSTYTRLPDSTTTVCQITLENGYTLVGTSACVDPANFNQSIGEMIAYRNAFEKLWDLEGYLLKQRRFEAGLSWNSTSVSNYPKTPKPPQT